MTKLLSGTILVLVSQAAFAFGEDLCMNLPAGNGEDPLFNCITLPENCKPGNNTAACRAAAFNSVPTDAESISGGRSLLHVDATYYIAQAIGFDSWSAYQIAMYDGDTDTGQYIPHNQEGQKIITDPEACFKDPKSDPLCPILPPFIKGVNRFNGDTGGLLVHFAARFNVDPEHPTEVPFPYDYFSDRKHEKQITDIRDWAFSKDNVYCVSGLEKNTYKNHHNDHNSCEGGAPGFETFVKGRIPIAQFGPDRGGIELQAKMGEQIVSLNENNEATSLSSTLYKIMPKEQVKFAKMGIFLHSMQDRISHHLCTDTSTAAEQKIPGKPDHIADNRNDKHRGDGHHKPTKAKNYVVDYNKENCSQGNHMLWHGWEVAGDQSFLDADPSLAKFKTLETGLNATFDQLYQFARQQHIRITPGVDKATVVKEVMKPLQIFNPRQRIDSLVALFEAKGFTPLPGHGQMANTSDISNWLVQHQVIQDVKSKNKITENEDKGLFKKMLGWI